MNYKCEECGELISEREFNWSGWCDGCYSKNYCKTIDEVMLSINLEDPEYDTGY